MYKCKAIVKSGPRCGQICDKSGWPSYNNFCGNHRQQGLRLVVPPPDPPAPDPPPPDPPAPDLPTSDPPTPNTGNGTILITSGMYNAELKIYNKSNYTMYLYWINEYGNAKFIKNLSASVPEGLTQIFTQIGHALSIYSKHLGVTIDAGNIKNYSALLIKQKVIQYTIPNNINNITLTNDNILTFDVSDIRYFTIVNHYHYNEKRIDWMKPCVKTVSLLRHIKKLTDSDTIKELCDMEEYIEYPKELTIRDFQTNGAAYSYEYNDEL